MKITTTTQRPARGIVISALGLVVLASGCATNSGGQAATPPPRIAPSTYPSTMASGPIPTVDQPSSDQVPLPWQLNRIDAALNRIYLTINGQGCSSPQAVAVHETPATITITALGNKPTGTACTAQLTTIVGYISLYDPIGQRRLIHGS